METTTEAKAERSHSEQQAWAQLSSICEMIAKLTREGAAQSYVSEFDREKCIELITAEDSDFDSSHCSVEELRATLAEMIENETVEPSDFEFDEDRAREEIQEDPLSIQVRGDWYNPGEDKPEPSEFEILLCTGGPAVRIRGDLDEHNQPDRAYIEHQDWGTPWTQIFGLDTDQQSALLTYCQQFYFGE